MARLSPITEADGWFVGEDQGFEFPVTDKRTKAIKNVTGWTTEMRLSVAQGQAAFLTVNGSVSDGPAGLIIVNTTASDTQAVDPETYWYEFSRVDDGDDEVLAYGPAVLQGRAA